VSIPGVLLVAPVGITRGAGNVGRNLWSGQHSDTVRRCRRDNEDALWRAPVSRWRRTDNSWEWRCRANV